MCHVDTEENRWSAPACWELGHVPTADEVAVLADEAPAVILDTDAVATGLEIASANAKITCATGGVYTITIKYHSTSNDDHALNLAVTGEAADNTCQLIVGNSDAAPENLPTTGTVRFADGSDRFTIKATGSIYIPDGKILRYFAKALFASTNIAGPGRLLGNRMEGSFFSLGDVVVADDPSDAQAVCTFRLVDTSSFQKLIVLPGIESKKADNFCALTTSETAITNVLETSFTRATFTIRDTATFTTLRFISAQSEILFTAGDSPTFTVTQKGSVDSLKLSGSVAGAIMEFAPADTERLLRAMEVTGVLTAEKANALRLSLRDGEPSLEITGPGITFSGAGEFGLGMSATFQGTDAANIYLQGWNFVFRGPEQIEKQAETIKLIFTNPSQQAAAPALSISGAAVKLTPAAVVITEIPSVSFNVVSLGIGAASHLTLSSPDSVLSIGSNPDSEQAMEAMILSESQIGVNKLVAKANVTISCLGCQITANTISFTPKSNFNVGQKARVITRGLDAETSTIFLSGSSTFTLKDLVGDVDTTFSNDDGSSEVTLATDVIIDRKVYLRFAPAPEEALAAGAGKIVIQEGSTAGTASFLSPVKLIAPTWTINVKTALVVDHPVAAKGLTADEDGTLFNAGTVSFMDNLSVTSIANLTIVANIIDTPNPTSETVIEADALLRFEANDICRIRGKYVIEGSLAIPVTPCAPIEYPFSAAGQGKIIGHDKTVDASKDWWGYMDANIGKSSECDYADSVINVTRVAENHFTPFCSSSDKISPVVSFKLAPGSNALYAGLTFSESDGTIGGVSNVARGTAPVTITIAPWMSARPANQFQVTLQMSAVCDAGYYCPNAEEVVICPIGHYCTEAEAPTPCDPGYACPQGSAAPSPCGIGNYCPQGTGEPLDCDPGTASDAEVAFECPACPIGTFAALAGSSECTRCPDGKTTEGTGSTSMYSCITPGGAPSRDDGVNKGALAVGLLILCFFAICVVFMAIRIHNHRSWDAYPNLWIHRKVVEELSLDVGTVHSAAASGYLNFIDSIVAGIRKGDTSGSKSTSSATASSAFAAGSRNGGYGTVSVSEEATMGSADPASAGRICEGLSTMDRESYARAIIHAIRQNSHFATAFGGSATEAYGKLVFPRANYFIIQYFTLYSFPPLVAQSKVPVITASANAMLHTDASVTVDADVAVVSADHSV